MDAMSIDDTDVAIDSSCSSSSSSTSNDDMLLPKIEVAAPPPPRSINDLPAEIFRRIVYTQDPHDHCGIYCAYAPLLMLVCRRWRSILGVWHKESVAKCVERDPVVASYRYAHSAITVATQAILDGRLSWAQWVAEDRRKILIDGQDLADAATTSAFHSWRWTMNKHTSALRDLWLVSLVRAIFCSPYYREDPSPVLEWMWPEPQQDGDDGGDDPRRQGWGHSLTYTDLVPTLEMGHDAACLWVLQRLTRDSAGPTLLLLPEEEGAARCPYYFSHYLRNTAVDDYDDDDDDTDVDMKDADLSPPALARSLGYILADRMKVPGDSRAALSGCVFVGRPCDYPVVVYGGIPSLRYRPGRKEKGREMQSDKWLRVLASMAGAMLSKGMVASADFVLQGQPFAVRAAVLCYPRLVDNICLSGSARAADWVLKTTRDGFAKVDDNIDFVPPSCLVLSLRRWTRPLSDASAIGMLEIVCDLLACRETDTVSRYLSSLEQQQHQVDPRRQPGPSGAGNVALGLRQPPPPTADPARGQRSAHSGQHRRQQPFSVLLGLRQPPPPIADPGGRQLGAVLSGMAGLGQPPGRRSVFPPHHPGRRSVLPHADDHHYAADGDDDDDDKDGGKNEEDQIPRLVMQGLHPHLLDDAEHARLSRSMDAFRAASAPRAYAILSRSVAGLISTLGAHGWVGNDDDDGIGTAERRAAARRILARSAPVVVWVVVQLICIGDLEGLCWLRATMTDIGGDPRAFAECCPPMIRNPAAAARGSNIEISTPRINPFYAALAKRDLGIISWLLSDEVGVIWNMTSTNWAEQFDVHVSLATRAIMQHGLMRICPNKTRGYVMCALAGRSLPVPTGDAIRDFWAQDGYWRPDGQRSVPAQEHDDRCIRDAVAALEQATKDHKNATEEQIRQMLIHAQRPPTDFSQIRDYMMAIDNTRSSSSSRRRPPPRE